ncbi:hypothetical protein RJT34_14811 [Clitoria ternatea]|uniref:Uncharacterized protein n=1 Tax=Clitoria ternatea TaxID=43366 RepID=A0AAN9JRK8_CLITE
MGNLWPSIDKVIQKRVLSEVPRSYNNVTQLHETKEQQTKHCTLFLTLYIVQCPPPLTPAPQVQDLTLELSLALPYVGS